MPNEGNDTRVLIDADTGDLLAIQQPRGGSAGDVLMAWQYPLHSGRAFGWVGRIVVCITGLITVMLSVTGVVIWLRKRKKRTHFVIEAIT